jgi:hypothetical protein
MIRAHIIQVQNERGRLQLCAEDEYKVKVMKCFEKQATEAACPLYRDYALSYEHKFSSLMIHSAITTH